MNPLLQAAIQIVLGQLHHHVETVSVREHAGLYVPTVFFYCLDSDKRQESISTNRLTDDLENPNHLAAIAANIDRWLADHGAAPAARMTASEYTVDNYTESESVFRWTARVETAKPLQS